MSFPGDVIGTFKTGTYTVTRPPAGSYDTNGVFVPGSPSMFAIDASIQPLSGYDLQTLPEGRHSDATRKLYTTTELKIGDTVADNGTWEVFSVKTHGVLGTHYRALISLHR